MSKLLLEELNDYLSDNAWSDELPKQWEIFEDGDWTDEGKSESKTDVVKHLPTGIFFRLYFSRYGDHWKGYETSYEGANRVEPYEANVILWKEVK